MALEEIKGILEEAGLTPPDTIPDTTTTPSDDDRCPVCGGTGWEMIRLPEEQIRAVYGDGFIPECYFQAAKPCSRCSQAARIARARELSSPSLGVRLTDFDWTLYTGTDTTQKRDRVMEYIRNYPRLEVAGLGGLYISSKACGTGKTFLAQCICGELINQYACNALFVTEADLLEASKQRTEDGSDPLAKYIGVRLLVLDDLGQKNGAKQWVNDILFHLIDRRYKEKRGIIVTSNHSMAKLGTLLDARIVDRLYDMTRQVTLPDVSVRKMLSDRRKAEIESNLGLEA